MNTLEVVAKSAGFVPEPDYFLLPHNALGIPERAWELGRYVDDVSPQTLEPGMTFLLLHRMHTFSLRYCYMVHGLLESDAVTTHPLPSDRIHAIASPIRVEREYFYLYGARRYVDG